MGGISALYRWRNEPCDTALLARMIVSLGYRGNNFAVWHKGSVGLVVVKRKTSNLSLQIPTHIQITADVRLTNREQLLETLTLQDCPEKHISDEECIIAAYISWGRAYVLHLQGDFSFVLWDEKQAMLFGARSPMGTRRLVYHISEKQFACASTEQQLFEDTTISRGLNDTWVAFWLTQGQGHWDGTIYKDIQELLPGYSMTVNHNGCAVQSFWKCAERLPLAHTGQQEVIERFRSLLTASVKTATTSSSPILFDLSGGLDSSSLVCIAAKQRENEGKASHLACFHAYTDTASEVDTRIYISAIAKKYALDIHTISFREHSYFEGAFEPQTWQSRPCIPLLILGSFYHQLWTIAHSLGAGVHIRGDFGDQVVGASLGYLTTCWNEHRYGKLFCEAQAWKHVSNVSRYSLLESYILQPRLQRDATCLSAPWLRSHVWKQSELRQEEDNRYFRTMCPDPFQRELFKWMRFHGDYITQAEGALYAGLETREPYADIQLIEFLLSIPPQYQLRPLNRKFLLREAMKDILPEAVRERREKGHAYRLYFRGVAKHLPVLRELVHHLPDILAPYIDPALLVQALERVSLGDEVAVPSLSGTLALLLWAHRLPWANGKLPRVAERR